MAQSSEEMAKDAATLLMRACNGASRSLMDQLFETLAYEHRFIQGEVISVLCRLLYRMGKAQIGTDGRNEHAIMLCRALASIADTGEATPGDINRIRSYFFT